jgi:RNA-directed DNA polymerase
VLDELDHELERRGHRYVRYADDCNIYVRSERAGHRVMASITRFITQRLKLKVNEAKSAVARPQERKFLGFSFASDPEIRRAIAPKALARFKDKVREITRQAKGISIETTVKRLATYMVGWRGYFGFCETPEVLIGLIRWVRLRLRCALWRQWKTPRRRRAALLQLGVRPRLAANTPAVVVAPGTWPAPKLSPWEFRMHTSIHSDYLHCSRTTSLTSRTAVYGPVRTVVWQGSAGDCRPYADQAGFTSM